MFSILDSGSKLCDGMTRREWLRIGGLSALGLSLPQFQKARAQSTQTQHRASFGRARGCIMICLLGGPPQHETWDPKPEAIAEIRGPFSQIASTVPGLQVGELMPRLADRAHHFAVLRGVSSRDNAHSSSGYYMLTGHPHIPMNAENARAGAPNNAPCVAAVVNRMKARPGGMPAALVVPENIWNDGVIPWPGQDAGWLGRSADPWLLNCDPAQPGFEMPGLTLPPEVTPLRLDRRRALLEQVNRHLSEADQGAAVAGYQGQFGQALDLMRAGAVRSAFDLSQEPASVRDRYGRSRFAQSLLLARRLVEAGMPLVQVNWTRLPNLPTALATWDTHSENARALRDHLMPIMDPAVSALVDDLHARGLLDETLVYWMGEFGRTPRINGAGGRDHWGSVYSVALAGGGARGGVVHGASDRLGAHPRDGMVRPEDLTATVFHLLGLDPHAELRDTQGRGIPLSRGNVITQII